MSPRIRSARIELDGDSFMGCATDLLDRAMRLIALADHLRLHGNRDLGERLLVLALDCLDDAMAAIAAESQMQSIIGRLER